MKKIIATAAGLMVAGSAVVATAAVEFSGDARARYYYQDNYNSKNDSADHWNSRVRLNVKATTAGGSFAKARIVMQDSAWGAGDTANDTLGDNDSSIDVDRAYVGVPIGNDLLLTAGRQPLNLSTGFLNDIDLDNVRLKYEADNTKVTGFYSVIVSDSDSGNGEYDDAEDTLYGAAIEQGVGEWTIFAGLAYQSTDLSDDQESGVMTSVGAAGQLGPIALTGELGFQEDGVVATDELAFLEGVEATGDDGFGGYFTAGMDFNALNVTFLSGATTDGFTFDIPVGFVMIGGDNQITPGKTYAIGHYDGTAVDTYFAGFKTNYTATQDLGFGFNLAYANMESSNTETADLDVDGDLYEVSATAAYTINDGTMLYVNAGYLDVEWEEDPTIGFGVSLELAF